MGLIPQDVMILNTKIRVHSSIRFFLSILLSQFVSVLPPLLLLISVIFWCRRTILPFDASFFPFKINVVLWVKQSLSHWLVVWYDSYLILYFSCYCNSDWSHEDNIAHQASTFISWRQIYAYDVSEMNMHIRSLKYLLTRESNFTSLLKKKQLWLNLCLHAFVFIFVANDQFYTFKNSYSMRVEIGCW